MNQYCVVVANGTRARFFSFKASDVPELETGPQLIEHDSLVNPEKEAHPRDLWSEEKTGRNRGSKSGSSHGYDDHRNSHAEEYEKRFAASIAQQCNSITMAEKSSDIILVSQKKMLGFLRTALDSKLHHVKTRELAKDLSKLTVHELHEHLAKEKLLPQRQRPL